MARIHLTQLKLTDFRNYASLRLDCDEPARRAHRRERRGQDQSAGSRLVPVARPRAAAGIARRESRAAAAPAPGRSCRDGGAQRACRRSAPALAENALGPESVTARAHQRRHRQSADDIARYCRVVLADAGDGRAVHRTGRATAATSSTGWCWRSIRRMGGARSDFEKAMRGAQPAAGRAESATAPGSTPSRRRWSKPALPSRWRGWSS